MNWKNFSWGQDKMWKTWIGLDQQGWVNPFDQGQMVNILIFVGHTVCATITQFCFCKQKSNHRLHVNKQMLLCSIKLNLRDTESWISCNFHLSWSNILLSFFFWNHLLKKVKSILSLWVIQKEPAGRNYQRARAGWSPDWMVRVDKWTARPACTCFPGFLSVWI